MSQNLAQRVFDVTSQFITLLDSLELGVTSVDGIAPALKQIYQTLKDYPNLPTAYKGTQCIESWCAQLQKMKATDELSEAQIRELKFNLAEHLQSFKDILS